MGYRFDDQGDSWQRQEIFLYAIESRPALMPPSFLSNGYHRCYATMVWSYHSPPPSFGVKNCGTILPLPIYFHGIELNWLRTGTTLPFHFTFWRQEVTGREWKLYNKELNNLHSSTTIIIIIIKSKKMRWMGNGARKRHEKRIQNSDQTMLQPNLWTRYR
jgi:hypothetical protein